MLQLLKPIIGTTSPCRQPLQRRPVLSSFEQYDLTCAAKPLSAEGVHQLVLSALTSEDEESYVQVAPGWLFGPEFAPLDEE